MAEEGKHLPKSVVEREGEKVVVIGRDGRIRYGVVFEDLRVIDMRPFVSRVDLSWLVIVAGILLFTGRFAFALF